VIEELRELVFVVADKAMQQLLEGFFGRERFHHALGCRPFEIDARPNRDVFVAEGQNDSGLYKRAAELLRPHRRTHKRAIVLIDAEWGGTPGANLIMQRIEAAAADVWDERFCRAIVLDPEVEAWLWQPDSPHLAAALNYGPDKPPYRQVLAEAGYWPAHEAKPPRPKEAREYLRRVHRTDPSNAVFRRAAARVSVRGCADPAFLRLCETLREWFPSEGR
jgi:hypothetical protein